MLKVSMHQPNFLPYVGFFEKIKRSDLFVIVDHLTFSKGKDNWHHRNRIRTNNNGGWDYITMPVSEHWNWKPFTEAKISMETFPHKRKKHLKTIEQNYSKAPYFHKFFSEFKELYSQDEESLAEFNINLIMWFLDKFDIKTKVLRASQLEFDKSLKKTDMIVEIMKTVGGTHFISGDGAKDYIEPEKFEKAGLTMEFQNFQPATYPQIFPEFQPFMSALDMLMNVGCLETNGHTMKPNGGSLNPNGG